MVATVGNLNWKRAERLRLVLAGHHIDAARARHMSEEAWLLAASLAGQPAPTPEVRDIVLTQLTVRGGAL